MDGLAADLLGQQAGASVNALVLRLAGSALLAILLVFSGCRWQAKMDAGEIAAKQDELDALVLASANAQIKASEEARQAERNMAMAANAAAASYEQGKRDAENLPAAVVAGIGNGAIKLRKQWEACETGRVSDSAAASRERDELAELRKKDQGDLVRVGRDADNQVLACQALIQVMASE